MKYIPILVLLFAFINISHAQHKISGTIINEKDGVSIPYATLFVKEEAKGTISNEEGEFELLVKNLPVTIEINHVLFNVHQLTISTIDDDKKILLTPATLELPTALADGKYAQNLIEKALNKAKKEKISFNGEGFYRQITKQDNNYTEALEAFIAISHSNRGIHEWEIDKGRYARTQEKNAFRYTNFSYFTRGFVTFPEKKQKGKRQILHPLDLDAQKFYFDPEKHIYKENKEIAIIHCYPRKQYQHIPHIEAWYYIDTKTYDIIQIEGKIPHDLDAKFIIGDLKSKNSYYKIMLHFKEYQTDGNLVLDFIKSDGIFPIYQKDDYQYDMTVSSVLYCFNSERSNFKRKKKTKREIDDLESIAKAAYKSIFWENNSILKRNPLEEKAFIDFEKNGYWGNLFDNDNNQ